MRVFVTGANGFVGRHACESLLDLGCQVTGSVRRLDRTKLPQMAYQLTPSIDGETHWKNLLSGVDTIVHAAGRAHQSDGRTDAIWRVNVNGTKRLAQEAVKAGVRRFIFVSSVGAEKVESNPDSAQLTPYQVTKYEAERALQETCQGTDVEWVILRPPMIYGPGAPGNFGRLVWAILRGIPLPIAGIQNRRSFLYIGNFVSALSEVISDSRASGRILALRDDEEISTPEFVRRIALALDVTPRLFKCSPRLLKAIGRMVGKGALVTSLTDDLVVDPRAIRVLLGWAPPYTMEQALAVSVRWYTRAQQYTR